MNRMDAALTGIGFFLIVVAIGAFTDSFWLYVGLAGILVCAWLLVRSGPGR